MSGAELWRLFLCHSVVAWLDKTKGKKNQRMLSSDTTTVRLQLNKSNCRRLLKCLAELHGHFCIFWRIFRTCTVYVNPFYTIPCYVPFNVRACQMTPRTEEPSHNRWPRLKLVCLRFVHYDEQIIYLHVYWLFCQMAHQAFQDHTEKCTEWWWQNSMR